MQTADKLNTFKAYLSPAMNQKLAAMRAEGRDMINLGLGNPDFHPREHLLRALAEAISNPEDHHYPSACPVEPFGFTKTDRRSKEIVKKRRGDPEAG